MILRVGIIGFGRIGAAHARWLAASQSGRAVATYDPTPPRREFARAQGLNAFDSLDALLADSSIDAILVSSPTAMHFEHASAALAAGKHVMIEKPMAMNLDQAQRLVDDAAKRGKILSVFHNRRWDLDFLTVKAAIGSGVFGKVFNVESRLGQWASCAGAAAREWKPNWRNEAAFGGGGLYDWGSHFVDQIWRLMLPAKPLRVFAQLRGNVWSRDCDDFARVVIDFDDGATGLVEINTTTTRPLPRWHIDGTNGSAFSPYSPEYDTVVWASLRYTPPDGGESRTLPKAPPGLSETQIWEQFGATCRGEGKPAVTVRGVLPTMALLDAARQSSDTGAAVPLSDRIDWSD